MAVVNNTLCGFFNIYVYNKMCCGMAWPGNAVEISVQEWLKTMLTINAVISWNLIVISFHFYSTHLFGMKRLTSLKAVKLQTKSTTKNGARRGCHVDWHGTKLKVWGKAFKDSYSFVSVRNRSFGGYDDMTYEFFRTQARQAYNLLPKRRQWKALKTSDTDHTCNHFIKSFVI